MAESQAAVSSQSSQSSQSTQSTEPTQPASLEAAPVASTATVSSSASAVAAAAKENEDDEVQIIDPPPNVPKASTQRKGVQQHLNLELLFKEVDQLNQKQNQMQADLDQRILVDKLILAEIQSLRAEIQALRQHVSFASYSSKMLCPEELIEIEDDDDIAANKKRKLNDSESVSTTTSTSSAAQTESSEPNSSKSAQTSESAPPTPPTPPLEQVIAEAEAKEVETKEAEAKKAEAKESEAKEAGSSTASSSGEKPKKVPERGVMITYNVSAEKRAVNETINLFNEYAEKLFDEEDANKTVQSGDIIKLVEKEIRDTKTAKSSSKRFTFVNTNCKGIGFIRFNDERLEPVSFLRTIFKDLEETQTSKTRFVHRMVPLQHICSPSQSHIVQTATALIDRFFKQTTKGFVNYCVQLSCRNNTAVDKGQCISQIGKAMPYGRGIVNLKNPEIVIVVEVCNKLFGVSLVDEYPSFHEFKVRSMNPEAQHQNKQPRQQQPQKISDTGNNKKNEKKNDSEDDESRFVLALNEKGEVEVEDVAVDMDEDKQDAEDDDSISIF